MKIADVVEHWFQAHFHNNTFFQRDDLWAHVLAAKEDLIKRLEAGLAGAPSAASDPAPEAEVSVAPSPPAAPKSK